MKKFIPVALFNAVFMVCCDLFTLSPVAPINPLDPNNPDFIEIPLESISLSGSFQTFTRVAVFGLTVTYTPENTTSRGVLWSSSNHSIGTVDAYGTVTIISEGVFNITASGTGSLLEAVCTVTVSKDLITVSAYVPAAVVYGIGDSEIITLSPSVFDMIYIPGGITFPTGIDDSGSSVVPAPYWIGETEVTFGLWSEVFKWATGDDDMNGIIEGAETAGSYLFGNTGTANGASPPAGLSYPAHRLSWRDAIVWCNALTEYMNLQNSTSYECVYQDSGTPIRNSTTGVYDDIVPVSADGFRLLSSDEWELAARYIQDAATLNNISDAGDYYPGSYASGALADNPTEADRVANFSGVVHEVAVTELSNALGLYDMSGNLYEWVFDAYDFSHKIMRGGDYSQSGDALKLGYIYPSAYTYNVYERFGFRIARSAD